jgi:hypothetical protein
MADEAEWTSVSSRKKPDPQPQATTPLTKAQLKNKRRAAKRAAEARALLTVAATDDSLDAIAAREALTARAAAAATPPSTSSRRARRRSASSGDLSESEEEAAPPPSPHELVEAARRRLRKATKAERQCDDAAAKLVQTPSLAKDQGLVAKAERREGAAAAAAAARADLALAQAAVDADNAVKGARRAAAVARHHAEASQMLSVKFDDKYACAVCTEVLEAAVTTGVCEHVFCRGCLEDHCAQASKPSECVCPLCRKPLVNDESGRVEASAAALVRANMKKLRGECHCGARMPLSRLRDHLRACGPNAHLYPPRRKFGHEFRQPSFVGGAPPPSIDLAAEEEAALQAAILASLEG